MPKSWRASTTRKLAGTWAKAKTAQLQAQLETPQSYIEGGGSDNGDRFQQRKATREQLKEYHKIRVDGGVIATLLEARALMVFGTGGQFASEDDDVAAWLNDTLNDRDTLLVDIGTDAYFYGYSLGELQETRGGDFGEITLIQPWTTVPELNPKGEIESWEQEVETDGPQNNFSQTFDPDDILHFKTTKASGRDPVGMSMLGRAMDEAEAYHDHQEAIDNAIQMQAFPKFHVKLGREDGPVIDDNELRRARPMFDDIHELTKWVTGRDVDIDVIEAENFEFEGITEHDLSKLAIAFMLPIELTQIGGGDGLGTGFPAKLRRQLFLLGARADQRLLGDQFVQQVGRPLLAEYAPDDVVEDAEDVPLEFVFDDPITDVDELQSQINAVGADMTVDERRDLFDLPPLDDEDIGDDFEQPGRADQSPPPEAEGDGFSGDYRLADLSPDRLAAEFDTYRAGFETIVWGDLHDLADPVFGQDEDVPANVQNRIQRAADNLRWDQTDGAPAQNLKELFVNRLSQPQGWSINSLAGHVRDQFGIEADRAENVARTKSAQLLNEATDMAIDDLAEGVGDEIRVAWVGPLDDDTTDACSTLQEETDPDHGGTPLPRTQFDARKAELAAEHFPEFDVDGEAIHWQERHRKEPYLPRGDGVEPISDAGVSTAVGDD